MAKKTKGESKGETCALVVIILVLVAGIGFYFGRGFVANMFSGEKENNSKIERNIDDNKKTGFSIKDKYNEFIEKNKSNKEEVKEENTEASNETVEKEEPKKEDKKLDTPKKEEAKTDKKSDKSKDKKSEKKKAQKKISKEDANAIKVLENVDRNNNTREADAELLEQVDRKNNMESAE